ncbi:MAG: AAA family ATPase [Gammaproteobacteria bacterium]|nr:AAA family ATPase [Gammaproteobacteria bacterium]MDH4255481.1 AAA family ATPase [Gammaproteobacteria bacterium]
MTGLELRFLGDFEVLRDGRALPLPPSKKTRALLAYLCLQPRRFRREHLCELLWEVPDDPRGSLRWSLSKLRRLVDDKKRARIVADRNSVGMDPAGATIDVRELRELVGGDLASAQTAELEAAAARFRGNFLEGLEFSNFHEFHTWCVAEREQALRDRAALLSELLRRLADEPERALPHARALVGLFPYEEAYRASLIHLLNAAHQPAEAEEQYQVGLRMLKEVGAAPRGIMQAARRSPRIDALPKSSAVPLPPPVRGRPAGRGLIGRDAEVRLVAETFEKGVARSRAGLMLLTGSPGMGKTHLMNHLRALSRERDAFVLSAAAFESDTIRPFALWLDALRATGDGQDESIFGTGNDNNRDRLFAGLSDLAGRESAKRPVVLIFDDVHWCDESSAAALHYVLRMNRDRPVLGVATARDGELRDNAPMQLALRGLRRDNMLTEVQLEPLSLDVTEALIASLVPGADAARLARESGGNPLLAIELAHAEVRGADSGSLSDLVRDWLARFGVDGAEVLRWAAVLSPRIELDTLVRLTGLDTSRVGPVLEDAERHGMLLATDSGPRFAHELIARAVYTDISPLRRQVMHRRVAELLEQAMARDLSRAADLAHHAALSEDKGLAARALVSAGRLCLRFFANDDALSLARQGLQLAEQLPDAERVRVEIELHDILLAAGPLDDWEAAAKKYTALAERALDHGELAHARLGYHMASTVRWEHGHWNAAREQSMQALRVVRGGQDESHIVGVAETAKCLVMIERDLVQADAMLMEVSALAERNNFSHQAIAAGLGMLRFHENRLGEAEELFREARTLCKSAGDRVSEYQANEYLVMLDLQRGRCVEARERCNELLMLGEKLRGGSEEPFARAILGLCNYAIDDESEGLDAALADLRVADAKHRLAYILTRAALLDCERGRVDSAVARATEALDYAALLERATEMLIANAVLSHAGTSRGDRQAATVHAKEVERLHGAGAAAWTHEIVERLKDKRGRTARREAK